MQKTNSVWEINAETRTSLHMSFERLAQSLATTDSDKRTLRRIQEIGDHIEKERKVILFVREHLRVRSHWILIYDNVVTFADIEKHFPKDPDWGRGKIIITTRDNHIRDNAYVDHIIPIGVLSPHQKFLLFKTIMVHNAHQPFTEDHVKEAKLFLENIPPFPLDVSIAAYYLKATRTSFEGYLENLFVYSKDFHTVQENLLKEEGSYIQTRYSIITTSLQQLIDTRKDFSDLLLLVSFLDSQNIPKDLLENLKNNIIVDHFMVTLRQYSILTHELSSYPSLSLHRSTQAISLAYLIKKLGLEKNKKSIQSISENLLNYIEKVINKEDLVKMKVLTNHLDMFLTHQKLLTTSIEGTIKGQLGIIYYFFGDNIKSRNLLEEGIIKLNKSYKNHIKDISIFMVYLGNVFRDLGDYNKGKKFLEKSLSIYQKNHSKNNLNYAYCLVYLGIIERLLGNYEVAKNLFEKGADIHKTHFPGNENYTAWVCGQLGILDRELGDYEKAKNIFEASLKIFKRDRSFDHFDIAWALEHLGVVYRKLGRYEEAKEALEQSLKSYASRLPDHLGSTWILACCEPLQTVSNNENIRTLFNKLLVIYKTQFHGNYIDIAYPIQELGNLYVQLGNYPRARVLLEQSLCIYQKNYGEFHLTAAKALNDLGEASLLEGNLEKSKCLFMQALKILQQYNHPEIYSCFERLSELFLKKSILEMCKGHQQSAQSFKDQAISFLKQALEITMTHFKKRSPHFVRIQSKLKSLQKNSENLSHQIL